MKQAQADADELIAAYRREQQDAFDKKVAMEGKFQHFSVLRGCTVYVKYSPNFIRVPQADPAETLRRSSKPKPIKKSRICKDNSNQMLKRPWMFFSQSAARSVWRFPLLGLGLHRSCMATKLLPLGGESMII